MRKMIVVVAALPLLSGGCVARTAWDVATLPVKAVGKTYDLATTSQAEADRNYGRKMRLEEERRGREAREAQKRAAREARKRGEQPVDRDLGDY